MKKIAIISLIMFLIACGGTDKNAEIAKLKKQRDELNEKIKKLESEVKSDSTLTANNGKAKQISVKPVAESTFDHYIEIQGKLDGDENVGVTAQTLGVVKNVYIKAGDPVKKGQVLAEFDASVYEQTLKELEASYEFVKDLYERQKALWEQKVGSEVQYLTAKNNKESLENRIKTMKEQIDMTKITAPINGTVEDVQVKVGQAVQPGLNVFRVVNFTKVKVLADVSETYASKIRTGDKAILRFPDINHEVTSTVNFASKFINPINRTFQVEIRFTPESNMDYKANMVVVTKINDYHKEKAIVLPINYVQTDNSGSFVYIAEKQGDNTISKKRMVTTGVEYNGYIEIVNGLNIGEQIITVGYMGITDGEPVIIR